jgi:hypothetical protein
VARSWPTENAGALVAWRINLPSGGGARVELEHFGDALGATAQDVLARDPSDTARQPVLVKDIVLPHEPTSAPVRDGAAWLARLTPLLDEVAAYDALHACLGVPDEGDADGRETRDAGARDVRRAALAAARYPTDVRASPATRRGPPRADHAMHGSAGRRRRRRRATRVRDPGCRDRRCAVELARDLLIQA